MLELYADTDEIIKVSFGGVKVFCTARDHCFREIMNIQEIYAPTYLALFVDNEMTKGLKCISN